MSSNTKEYIDNALLNLTSAWADMGSMNVTCPQITDSMSHLSRQVRYLYDEQVAQKKLIEGQQEVIDGLLKELINYKDLHREQRKIMDDLTNDTTGFVRHKVLDDVKKTIPDKAMVSAMREDVTKIQHVISTNLAQKRDLDETQRDVRSLCSTLDEHRKDMIEETANIRKFSAQFEGDTRKTLHELEHRTSSIETEYNRRCDTIVKEQNSINQEMANDLTLAQTKLSQTFEHNVQDIIDHLKVHADSIETLQQEKTERQRKVPTLQEVAQMRSDMDRVKNETQQALFRVQEVFSQCQAMYAGGTVASSTGGARRLTGSPAPAGAMTAAYGNSGGAVSSNKVGASSRRREDNTLLNEASSILSSIQEANAEQDQKSGAGMPSSVELQMDLLKRDVHRVVTLVVPSCIDQIQNLKEQVDSVSNMSTRASKAMLGLCECVGLEDGGDELLAACLETDYAKAIVILRSALGTIASDGYAYPSPTRTILTRVRQDEAKTNAATGSRSAAGGAGGSSMPSPASFGTGLHSNVEKRHSKNPMVGTTHGLQAMEEPSAAAAARSSEGSATNIAWQQQRRLSSSSGVGAATPGGSVRTPGRAASNSITNAQATDDGGIRVGSPYRPLESQPGAATPNAATQEPTQAAAMGYDERYSTLPQLNALHAEKFSMPNPKKNGPPASKPGAPTLGVDCADTIGGDGVQVMSVAPGSAAARAGLKKGDRIISLKERPIKNCTEFVHALSTTFILAKSQKLNLGIVKHRESEPQTITLEY